MKNLVNLCYSKKNKNKIDELQSMQDDKKISMLMPSRDTSYLESNYSELDEINELSKKKHCTDIHNDSDESSDSEWKDNDFSKPNYLETKTKNYKKYHTKMQQSWEKKPKSAFSLNNISQRISNTFKTIRNIKKTKSDESTVYPVYFRYLRINEIGVSLTYKHSDGSMLNTKNLRIIIKPFIKHSKFVTFQRMLNKYERFWKRSLIYQIPSILKQKLLKITLSKDEDDDEFRNDQEGNQNFTKAKQILFGKFADYS